MIPLTIWAVKPTDPLILTICLVGSWLLCHRIYNRYFHPLAHVPGPFFGRMSPWPSVYHARRGDRHLWLEHCFHKYGNKIRVEPNTVLFRSPTASRDIYGSKANVRRADFYDGLMRREEDRNTITTTDNAAHEKRRKLLNLAFTEKSLRAAGAFMQKHIDRWNELLVSDSGDDWSEPRNFSDWANYLVFDILGDICYGRSFEIKEPGENAVRAIPRAIVKTMKFIYPITKTPFLSVISYLRPRGLSTVFQAIRSPPIKIYDEFVESSVKERLEREKAPNTSGTTREDMFHFLCNAKNPDTNLPAFSDPELFAEARLLLIAGSDSTSVTMCGLFFYLAHYQNVLDKLRKEVTDTFSSADDVMPGQKLSSCKYLRACIDEALRMAPAGLCELPRQVLSGGMTIDGEHFPEGVVVGTAAWTDGHNEEVYGDADVFRPERWMPDQSNSAEEVSRIKTTFHPFSLGPFNCAGTNFALQELMLMVAKTVHRLEFRLAPGYAEGEGARHKKVVGEREIPQFQLEDAFITVREGPILQFRRR
ncbi:cytochrome P450 monooxygenase-like protein [Melanomma pulvis-pyrius CBS 109.77]|uniref:Cytochrome P450 monooxygenase-like protein n=1 Tax=Melanomma pulvis-pyrius CBS 109.77 TaxID=1314802 RepID=A0A6A6X5J8_9PLEO|nr:cytochrome P450 monooxygenase-like protein [Melanomma pulvis-pyrius CBS 109.77]